MRWDNGSMVKVLAGQAAGLELRSYNPNKSRWGLQHNHNPRGMNWKSLEEAG